MEVMRSVFREGLSELFACMQELQYAKDESIALQETSGKFNSRKKLKAGQKAGHKDGVKKVTKGAPSQAAAVPGMGVCHSAYFQACRCCLSPRKAHSNWMDTVVSFFLNLPFALFKRRCYCASQNYVIVKSLH